jgi:hypothetical protein
MSQIAFYVFDSQKGANVNPSELSAIILNLICVLGEPQNYRVNRV